MSSSGDDPCLSTTLGGAGPSLARLIRRKTHSRSTKPASHIHGSKEMLHSTSGHGTLVLRSYEPAESPEGSPA